MRAPFLKVLGLASALALFGSAARAGASQLAYEYAIVGGTGTGMQGVSVVSGSTTPIAVNIYLLEGVPQGGNSLLTPEQGLKKAAFMVAPIANSLTSPSVITSTTDDSTDFNGGSNVAGVSSGVATVVESQQLSPPDATGVELGNSPSGTAGSNTSLTLPPVYVFLGAIDITPGTSVGQSVFEVGEYNTAGGNTLSFLNSYDLDVTRTSAPTYFGASGVTTDFTVEVTAPAPEPASIGLLGLASLGLLIRRRRAL